MVSSRWRQQWERDGGITEWLVNSPMPYIGCLRNSMVFSRLTKMPMVPRTSLRGSFSDQSDAVALGMSAHHPLIHEEMSRLDVF